MRRLAAACLAACLPVLGPSPAPAQDAAPMAEGAAPILIIDPERLFTESRLGERISTQIEEAADALAEENRRIEAELIAEELALTEERRALAPDDFREKAHAFDEKVQRLRDEQDEKERAWAARRDADRQDFLARIAPVLGDLARERGAVAILDRRAVFLAAGSIDITDQAIERLNDAIDVEGTGDGPPPPPVEDGMILPPPGLSLGRPSVEDAPAGD